MCVVCYSRVATSGRRRHSVRGERNALDLRGHLHVSGRLVRVERGVEVRSRGLGCVRLLRALLLERFLLLRRSGLSGGDNLLRRLTAVAVLLAVLLHRLLLQARESLGDGLVLSLLRRVDNDDLKRTAVELDAVVPAHRRHGGFQAGKSHLSRALRLAVGAVVDSSIEHLSDLAEKFLRFMDRRVSAAILIPASRRKRERVRAIIRAKRISNEGSSRESSPFTRDRDRANRISQCAINQSGGGPECERCFMSALP